MVSNLNLPADASRVASLSATFLTAGAAGVQKSYRGMKLTTKTGRGIRATGHNTNGTLPASCAGHSKRATNHNHNHKPRFNLGAAVQSADIKDIVRGLVPCLNQRGEFPVSVTVHLTAAELLALARKEHHTGESMDNIIEAFLCDGPSGSDGIMETLRDYEG